jgi:prepilin-type processing-associated H-X9-DG protein
LTVSNTDVHCMNWRSRRLPSAFTVVELLTACTLLSLLVGMLLPAISRSRESARRLDCQHRLRQVGLALTEHHDVTAGLPAGWTLDPTRVSAFGWFLRVLPFTENAALGAGVNMTQRLSDMANTDTCLVSLPLAICPSDVEEPLFALYEEIGTHEMGGQRSDIVLAWLASANFVGVFGTRDPDAVAGSTGDGTFIESRNISFSQLERGLSNTLLVGERTASKLPSTWVGFAVGGEDAQSRIVGFANLGPNRDDADESEFASRHPSCANFLWADGHVAPIPDSIDPVIYRGLATRGQDADQ